MLETVSAVPGALGNASPSATLGEAVNVNPFANSLESWITSYSGVGGLAADLLSAALILVVFLVLSVLVRHFVKDVAPRLVSKTGSSLDDELLKAVQGPAQALIIVAGIYLACKTLNGLSSGIIDIMDKLTSIVLIFVGAYFIANVLSALIRWYVRDVAPKTESDLDDHLMPFLSKFLVAAVYIVGLVMAIGLFTPITPLLAGLGVFGIAVALAAKEMLANLFGAFAILTDRPFKVGDRLYMQGIGNGDVLDIGMRSTRVRTTDNRVVIVPNEKIASGRIVNLSRPDSGIRLDLKVGIGYRSDADKACALLEKIASETPKVSKDPRPRAYVSELSDFAVMITVLVWIDDCRGDHEVPDAIYRKALAAFKSEGIEIPFPTMTIMPK